MKRIIFVLFLLQANLASALDLQKDVLDRVFAATYEVVVAKPTTETVEYERELPLHLLPYQYRVDKYYSIGSAFRIEGNKFISAAHVFNLGFASQDENMGLRDGNGNVYPIDQVYKYSKSRDFIVFTVKGIEKGKSLQINTEYSKNNQVYAVGNALGEGVVIRDGLYTSDTPEENAGEWNWIRFSAAASPGNSGGPLLDDKGNVVGVVLRKSKNENLNYALPIKEVMTFKEVAMIKSDTMRYKYDFTDDTYSFKYHRSHDLPMDIKEIDETLQKDYLEIFSKAADDFLKEHEKRLFPNDKGSIPILYNRVTAFFPNVIMKGNDDIWDTFRPKNISASDTGNGGRVEFGKMGHFFYLKVKRPENVDFNRYYSDSKFLMDQILKGIGYSRPIGGEKIRVVSMGKSIEDRIHEDDYGRKWQVRNWLVSFSDEKFVMYALPTPDGYAVMLSITNTGNADYMEIDMKVIANNLYLSYYGTLDDWKNFIKLDDITPEFMNDISIETDKKSYIEYKDDDFIFRADKNNMKVSDKSDIQLRCSYFFEDGKVVWKPTMVVFGENKNANDYASVSRNPKPPESLDERYRKRWDYIVEQRSPYNAKAYINDQTTNITLLKAKDNSTLQNNDVIYAISWHESGKISDDIMRTKVKSLYSNFRIVD
ncbi:MAG: trypsin-like peptidase domain-containing protein [Gammaproteobacteria bacterium]